MVLFAGKYIVRKGIHLIVEAANEILKKRDDVVFVFVGGDSIERMQNMPYKNYLKKLASKEHSKNFIFLGRKKRDELVDYYNACDIFICPSLYEALGNIYLEAMACGKPIIASKIGGAREIIKHGESGLLVQPNTQDVLKALNKLLADEKLRLKLGKNARRKILKDLTIRKTATNTVKTYRQLLAKKS